MDNTTKKLKKLIKQGDFRFTKQRRIILDILQNSHEHLTPNQIYNIARSNNTPIGIATIYRTLQLFSKHGIIRKLETGRGKVLYELIEAKKEHSHFICKKCGKIIEMKELNLTDCEKFIPDNFRLNVTDCSVRLFGYCNECIKSKEESK